MHTAPKLKNKFVCIVDRQSPALAAMVSSYVIEDDYYLPLFEIQGVTAPRTRPIANPPDEHTFSQQRAETVTNAIRNAIVRLNGCENIILVGLSEDQRSYLQVPDGFNVISIDHPEDVDVYLSPFFIVQKQVLTCRPEEVLIGLQQAVQAGHWLNIDPQAMPLPDLAVNTGAKCVVIEDDGSAMAVVAVNYALSEKAEVIVVPALAEDEDKDIRYWLSDWKEKDDQAAYQKILDKITTRIGEFDFSGYNYVTFFTGGIPYSLLVGQDTCCTYVHLQHRPDHFTFDNVLYANIPGTGGGLVFSPQVFVQEEIEDVRAALGKMNFHVQPLLGKQATVDNLSQYLTHYPCDLVHFCSHGGEIPGIKVRSEFIDSNGKSQFFEYDLVKTYSFTPFLENGEPVIIMHKMAFPRAYNGYRVGSDELKAQQYSPVFFIECQNAVVRNTTIRDELKDEVKAVPDSQHVECYDKNPFLAIFTSLAGGMKSVIFNNTCWSWNPVSASFLENGARGYIGTLWAVGNRAAVDTAISFYNYVRDMPVAQAIWEAAHRHQPDGDEKIYVFYGFHFTRLLSCSSVEDSKRRVFWQLDRRKEYFLLLRQRATEKKVRENLDFILAWHDAVICKMQQ